MLSHEPTLDLVMRLHRVAAYRRHLHTADAVFAAGRRPLLLVFIVDLEAEGEHRAPV